MQCTSVEGIGKYLILFLSVSLSKLALDSYDNLGYSHSFEAGNSFSIRQANR